MKGLIIREPDYHGTLTVNVHDVNLFFYVEGLLKGLQMGCDPAIREVSKAT